MNQSLACAGLAAVLVAGAIPAEAQNDPEIGSRLAQRRTSSIALDVGAAARAGQRFAGCVYLKQTTQVLAALSASDANDASKRLGALQVRGTCATLLTGTPDADSQRLSFPIDIYRGLLAEAAIRNRYSGAALEPRKRENSYARPWFGVTGRVPAVDEMSVCVVETDPAGVRALLATSPESDGERAAVRNLSPSLGPCLVAGTRLASNRQSLRAGLADALYHRLATPPSPSSELQR